MVLFPLIVWLGASGQIAGEKPARLCKFLGDISYPIYMTHFPLVYIYTGWVGTHKPTLAQALPVAVLTFGAAVLLAYVSLKFYDEPVRRWLKNRLAPR
ncbi:acyltransferase family protein [Hymenobacter cellulosivorans]|uniref:acyltransferase family protein n=1 Tax=Hymenobacter cellulosivorans TaxID=2932249 RepID=UPI0021D40528|nr:acyltransferase family protein [Hymenobacter cellulosivorans]